MKLILVRSDQLPTTPIRKPQTRPQLAKLPRLKLPKVKNSLGNGEVESSILSRSTIFFNDLAALAGSVQRFT